MEYLFEDKNKIKKMNFESKNILCEIVEVKGRKSEIFFEECNFKGDIIAAKKISLYAEEENSNNIDKIYFVNKKNVSYVTDKKVIFNLEDVLFTMNEEDM